MKTWSEAWACKFIAPEQLEEKVLSIKSQGKTIATLNGSFDLMHAGHLEIIYQASKQADCLIVALNSDCSIQKYKSQNRPIIDLDNRLKIMAALEFVDFVTWFSETDPCLLLEKIKPDVHVNGSEYGLNCIEADVVKNGGGKVVIVPIVAGLSTTSIVAKIKSL